MSFFFDVRLRDIKGGWQKKRGAGPRGLEIATWSTDVEGILRLWTKKSSEKLFLDRMEAEKTEPSAQSCTLWYHAHMPPVSDIILFIGVAAIFVLLLRRKGETPNDTAPLKERIGELQAQLESEKTEKNKLVGQNKQMYAEQVGMKEDVKALTKERDVLSKKVVQCEAQESQREKEFASKLQELTNAKQKFEQEQQRIIREDEEEHANVEAKRDRVWAEHEQNVIAQLTSLCKSPQLAFDHYTNTNLPEEFDGSLKPDFLIGFLDQYIIFDAKKSKSESLQSYVNDSIKKTVQKVKKNPKIALMIYLVVPSEAIAELKNFVYPLDGYTIYVVSPESLPPILASLKRITTYEFADQMDPQQRENIIQVIAELDFQIHLQNAANIILTKRGTDILEKAQRIDPEIAEAVMLAKQPMNAKASIAATELKKIVTSLTAQNIEIQQLVSPKAAVRTKDLKAAEEVLETML